ncbi:MAG TPA: IS3 family transposase [Firmicutes bacterium]|nr:IS3 family transposase [Bacillota bacterium]
MLWASAIPSSPGDFQDLPKEQVQQIRQSMSAKSDCYDNACAESFFAAIKKELIHRRRFSTRSQATLAIVNYIISNGFTAL